MSPFLIFIAKQPAIRGFLHFENFMLEPNIELQMLDRFRQVTHDLLAGGMQVRFERPAIVGEVVLCVDILQMDFRVGRRPHAPNPFMLLEHDRNKPVLFEDIRRGDPRDARADDSDP